MSLSEMIDKILVQFHQKHRDDLEVLIPLAAKVENVHSESKDVPKGLSDFLENLSLELESHMNKEEKVLFPMIKSGQGGMAQKPLQVMMGEHIEHEKSLVEMKRLAKNYVLPENACGSWTKLYQGVQTLESELLEHIAYENNELFPKVLNE
jgi:regulator of cell morphogenesis and NO signaling